MQLFFHMYKGKKQVVLVVFVAANEVPCNKPYSLYVMPQWGLILTLRPVGTHLSVLTTCSVFLALACQGMGRKVG
jgi:hypothetical protein